MQQKVRNPEDCPIELALEIVGDRWTLLILRECFRGSNRFGQFHQRLGLSRTLLSDRLNLLLSEGLMQKKLYQEKPDRFEYRLTEKGRHLKPVMTSLWDWGSEYCVGG